MSLPSRRGREGEHNNAATAQATNNSSNTNNNSPPDLRLQLKIDAVVAELRKCLVDHSSDNINLLTKAAERLIQRKELIKAAATQGNNFIVLNLEGCLSELSLPPATFNFAACSATVMNDLVQAIIKDTPVIDIATLLTRHCDQPTNQPALRAFFSDSTVMQGFSERQVASYGPLCELPGDVIGFMQCDEHRRLPIITGDSGSGKSVAALDAARYGSDSQDKLAPPALYFAAHRVFSDSVASDDQQPSSKVDRDWAVATTIAAAVFRSLKLRLEPSKTRILSAAPADVTSASASPLAEHIYNMALTSGVAASRDSQRQEEQPLQHTRITVIIDEMGQHTAAMRGMCSVAVDIQRGLALAFNLDPNTSWVRLIAVGTGADGRLNLVGSDVNNYQVIVMPPRDSLWKQSMMRLLSLTPQPNAVQRQFLDFLQNHLPQRVHDLLKNLRFAALFVNAIRFSGFFSSPPAPSASPSSVTQVPTATLVGHLAAWVQHALHRFVRLNGLKDCTRPGDEALRALQYVFNGVDHMLDDRWMDLACRYGLIGVSTQIRAVSNGRTAIAADNHVIVERDIHSVIERPVNRPRYTMSEPNIQIMMHHEGFLTSFATGVSGEGGTTVAWDRFEQSVVDFAFLCTRMPDFDGTAPHVQGCVSPLRRLVLNDFGRPLRCSRMLEPCMWIAPTAKFNGDSGKLIRDEITRAVGSSGTAPGAITILNLPRAPYADIIVCSPAKLVLIQCKHLETGKGVIAVDDIAAEMHKMGSPATFGSGSDSEPNKESVALTRLLLSCCGGNAKTVELVYLYESAGKSFGSDDGKFTCEAPKPKPLPKGAQGKKKQGQEQNQQQQQRVREQHEFEEGGIAFRHWVFDVTSHPGRIETLYPVLQGEMKRQNRAAAVTTLTAASVDGLL